jgi:hypothetical protein
MMITGLALAAWASSGRRSGVSESCGDPDAIEQAAMAGTLAPATIACLEREFEQGTAIERDQISRLEMADAYTRGDVEAWEKLIHRHLTEVDASDPDLAYKLALYEQKAGELAEAVHWAQVAWDASEVWTGSTYVSRRGRLLQIRTEATEGLLAAAQAQYTAGVAPAREVRARRDDAMRASREWLTWLGTTGGDSTPAKDACLRVSDDPAACIPLPR